MRVLRSCCRTPVLLCAINVVLASCARTTPVRPKPDAAGVNAADGPATDLAAGCPAPLVWTRVAGSPAGYRISGSGPGDLWLIAAGGDGGAPCVPNDPGGTLSCVGTLMRGDGATFSQETGLSDTATTAPLWARALGLWVAGPENVFVGVSGDTAVLRWDGAAWSALRLNDNREVDSLWGSGPDDVWGARSDGAYLGHWDGSTWTHVDSVSGGVMAGGAQGDFWVGGRGARLDGGTSAAFSHHEPSHAGCPADAAPGSCWVYDAGDDVTSPACLTPAEGDFCAVVVAGWATAIDQIWFVGNHTYHYDGSRWSCVPTPSASILHGVGGTSGADVWAVGEAGTILHFDGGSWSTVPSPTSNNLYGVWASGPCDVWAIGDAVYHAQPGGD
jgi:hypothetical protein